MLLAFKQSILHGRFKAWGILQNVSSECVIESFKAKSLRPRPSTYEIQMSQDQVLRFHCCYLLSWFSV